MNNAWKRYLMVDLVNLAKGGKSLPEAVRHLSESYKIPEETILSVYLGAGDYEENASE